ncbi:hypothetical protein [Tabrizicola soli]|uniref:Uncharacterized protein n=1 Tax=Tabrizicola soli TaxID=2185115 RepID=A0ABV7E0B1_9RHOB|nr:hypothetical protein [Tabrizicola soli]
MRVDKPPSARWKASKALSKLNYILVGDYEFDHQTRRYLALSFLILAVLIGFGSYTQTGIFRSTSVSFRPDFYSGMLAIGFVAALHVRRLIPISLSVYFLLSFSLNTTVTAIIVQGLLGTGMLFGLAMKTALPAALVLTWFGIRAIAPLVWLAVVLLGSFNLSSMGGAMGLWGFAFLILTVLGILVQVEGHAAKIKDNFIFDFTGRLPAERRNPSNPLEQTGTNAS